MKVSEIIQKLKEMDFEVSIYPSAFSPLKKVMLWLRHIFVIKR